MRKEPAYEKNVTIPANFFWMLDKDQSLMPAVPKPRYDTMKSHYLQAKTSSGGRAFLLIHDLLGWTFKSPPRLWTKAFGAEHDIDHINGCHHDNRLFNLQVWKAAGPGGHRGASGRLGGRGRVHI
jgi:hypothetical protein